MKRIISMLLVLVSLVSVLAVGASAASKYSDVEGHWGQSYVEYYTETGVVNGYPDGTFKPNNRITRAEAAQVLLNYFKFTGEGKGFSDVKPTDWYYKAVLASQQNGAFEGYEDGTFKPTANITRQEVIVMLRRITTAEEDMESGKHFIDYYDTGDWAKGSVGALRNVGVLDGYEEIPGTFYVRPTRLITRAEFVKLLFTIEKSDKVQWQVPGEPVQPDQPIVVPGGGGTPSAPKTYYNVEVSISGPDKTNAPQNLGPYKKYASTANSLTEGDSPILADVFSIMLTKIYGDNQSNVNDLNYESLFETTFGNWLSESVLKDMVVAYTESLKDIPDNTASVKTWNTYLNEISITKNSSVWKTTFADPKAGYAAAIAGLSPESLNQKKYTVEMTFTTPTDQATIDAYSAKHHNGVQMDAAKWGGKTYTVTVTIEHT